MDQIATPSAVKNYVLIGTEYFRRLPAMDKTGTLYHQLISWKQKTIIDDHGKHFCDDILKLKAFVNAPANGAAYQPVVANCYNRYHPTPMREVSTTHCDTIMEFLASWRAGEYTAPVLLDYLQLLWTEPMQLLPMVVLQGPRASGKSTMLMFLEAMLGPNYKLVGTNDLMSGYNNHWVDALVLGMDGEIPQDVEQRIAELKSADWVVRTDKHVKDVEQAFYGKFVITLDEGRCLVYPPKNTLFLSAAQAKVPNPRLMADMVAELPFFIDMLEKRHLHHKKESRYWFNAELLS